MSCAAVGDDELSRDDGNRRATGVVEQLVDHDDVGVW
jgi:hypothetical protein